MVQNRNMVSITKDYNGLFQHLNTSFDCIKKTTLFANLSDREISCFQKTSQSRSYKKGQIIYLQEDRAHYFYIIRSGWIKLFNTMPEGEEIIIDMLTTGSTAGESAIFENGNYTSSAEAAEDVDLLSIPSHTLREQLCTSPTLAINMLASMSQYHRRHCHEISLNVTQNAPQRIGCFLLRLCPPDEHKNIKFSLPYDKTLIAQTLGINNATFSRALNILRHKTNIRIKGTIVEIDTIDSLLKFVYGSLL
jgi:CRP-like cAMP-binding protein